MVLLKTERLLSVQRNSSFKIVCFANNFKHGEFPEGNSINLDKNITKL
jgi:hypothetical protein